MAVLTSPEDYLAQLPDEKRALFQRLRSVIVDNLPEGYMECLSYGMIGYVVPQTLYPKGYHCDPTLPLPFVSIAAQKNFFALYHIGLYASEELLAWWQAEYAKRVHNKLDMGKSCIRFKKPEVIPFELIGELMQKISVAQWINTYEQKLMR